MTIVTGNNKQQPPQTQTQRKKPAAGTTIKLTFPDNWFQGLPLPCPFAGYEGARLYMYSSNNILFWVECLLSLDDCYELIPGPSGRTAEEALVRWNTRCKPKRPWLRKPNRPGIWQYGELDLPLGQFEQTEDGDWLYTNCHGMTFSLRELSRISDISKYRFRYIRPDWPVVPKEKKTTK